MLPNIHVLRSRQPCQPLFRISIRSIRTQMNCEQSAASRNASVTFSVNQASELLSLPGKRQTGWPLYPNGKVMAKSLCVGTDLALTYACCIIAGLRSGQTEWFHCSGFLETAKRPAASLSLSLSFAKQRYFRLVRSS